MNNLLLSLRLCPTCGRCPKPADHNAAAQAEVQLFASGERLVLFLKAWKWMCSGWWMCLCLQLKRVVELRFRPCNSSPNLTALEGERQEEERHFSLAPQRFLCVGESKCAKCRLQAAKSESIAIDVIVLRESSTYW